MLQQLVAVVRRLRTREHKESKSELSAYKLPCTSNKLQPMWPQRDVREVNGHSKAQVLPVRFDGPARFETLGYEWQFEVSQCNGTTNRVCICATLQQRSITSAFSKRRQSVGTVLFECGMFRAERGDAAWLARLPVFAACACTDNTKSTGSAIYSQLSTVQGRGLLRKRPVWLAAQQEAAHELPCCEHRFCCRNNVECAPVLVSVLVFPTLIVALVPPEHVELL